MHAPQSAPATTRPAEPPRLATERETCPVCGSARLLELRCKIVCQGCRTILQSCADL